MPGTSKAVPLQRLGWTAETVERQEQRVCEDIRSARGQGVGAGRQLDRGQNRDWRWRLDHRHVEGAHGVCERTGIMCSFAKNQADAWGREAGFYRLRLVR